MKKPSKALPTEADLKARNAAFGKLSKANQRVAIAKDILSRISTKQLVGESGVWVNVPSAPEYKRDVCGNILNYDAIVDLQEQLNKGVSCECCALGAAMCGLAFYEDKIKVENQRSDYEDEVEKRLRQIFGKKQLELIETAFELGSGALAEDVYEEDGEGDEKLDDSGDPIVKPRYRAAVAFGERYLDDNKRLKAIWSNVLENGGTFKP